MNTIDKIMVVCLKHLGGQHNQKRHGWRYGGIAGARQSMRGQSASEREEYRKRAGMPKPEKKAKPTKKIGGMTGDEIYKSLASTGKVPVSVAKSLAEKADGKMINHASRETPTEMYKSDFRRWTKSGHDRLYSNDRRIPKSYKPWKTYDNGYLDLNTGQLYTPQGTKTEWEWYAKNARTITNAYGD